MTIKRGQDWGRPATLPTGAAVAATDAELREVVQAARRAGEDPPIVGLTGGDLWRTLGAPAGGLERLSSARATAFTVDIGAVLVDGRLFWFVSHLVARNSWWRGRVVAAMGAEFLGAWKVAPAAHPNDGRLDVLDTNLSMGQRWLARRRLPTGDHVPHPDIALRRTAAIQVEFDRSARVFLDGESIGRARTLSIRTEPDALTVIA